MVADIERLRADAATIAASLSAKESQLHNIDDLLAMEDGAAEPKRAGAAGAGPPTRSTRFIDAAHELLKGTGKPTHYRVLAQTLADQGVYVPGQDPAANLLAHMSRDVRFGRAGRRGVYGLADWPEVKTSHGGRTKLSHPSPRVRRRAPSRG